jgi:hypothetical protein
MHRKINILIFGLEEYKSEIFFDMLKVVGDILGKLVKLETGCKITDYVSRLWKGSD